jgi:hypothetical protein
VLAFLAGGHNQLQWFILARAWRRLACAVIRRLRAESHRLRYEWFSDESETLKSNPGDPSGSTGAAAVAYRC